VAVPFFIPEMAVSFGFKTFSPKNGITYRPPRNMALNRKIAENNFFRTFFAKIMEKVLEIKIKYLPL